MSSELRSFQYGTAAIEYVLVRRSRTTAEISVLKDGTVSVVAPTEASEEKLEEMLRRRMRWIRRQQADLRRLATERPQRHYVSGETHHYRGRRHRLLVRQGIQAGVKLERGRLVVTAHGPSNTAETRSIVDAWRRRRAEAVFSERIEAILPRFRDPPAVRPRGILIRRLVGRWGSMTPAGRLVLNLDLINAPTHAIDYVLAYEMCHRIEPNHSRAFWALLTEVMPDWRNRKEILEKTVRG